MYKSRKKATNCMEDLDDITNIEANDTNQDDEYPELKKGINLPKTNSEWLTANEHSNIP